MAKKPGPLQQAQAITRAQYAPVDYQLGQASKRATAEQHALNAARTALIAQLQGGVGPATQAYDAAAQQTQDIARSAADLLAQANPNAQVQQSLSQINAPQEQRQQLGQSLQSLFPGAGAVLNVEQGAIPGAGLVAQGAAQKQFLSGLPTVAALSGEQSLRSLMANQQKTRDDLVAQRLGIGGQLPGLVRDLQNRQEDVQYRDQQAANAIQQAALDRSFQAQQAEKDRAFREAQASIDYQRSLAVTPYQKEQIRLDQEKLNIDRAASKATTQRGGNAGFQYRQNKDGTVSIFNPNTGQYVKTGTPTPPGSVAGLTPSKLYDIRTEAHAKGNQLIGHVREARSAFKKNAHVYNGEFIYSDNKNYKTSPPAVLPTYDQAVQQAEQQGIPLEVAVPLLNRVFPAQYKYVPNQGLVQTGIRGQPSWTPGGKPRKRKKR